MAGVVQPNLFEENSEMQAASTRAGTAREHRNGGQDLLLRALQTLHAPGTAFEAISSAFILLQREAGVRALAVDTSETSGIEPLTLGEAGLFEAGAAAKQSPNETILAFLPTLPDTGVERIRFAIASGPFTGWGGFQAITDCAALRFDREQAQLGRARAETEAHRRAQEVEALYEIGQAIDRVDLARLLSFITSRASSLLEAQACSLMWVEPSSGRLRIEASYGLSSEALGHEQQHGEGIAGRVLQTEQPLRILADSDDPLLEGLNLRPEIGSSMIVPMKPRNGRASGVLSIRRRRPSPDFTEEDLKLFSVFASQATLAILNVKLYSDLKRRADELVKLAALTRALITTFDLNARLEHLADAICGVVGFERCCVYIRDTMRPAFVPCVWRGYPDSIGRNPVREREGAIGAVALGKTIRVFDARIPIGPERERDRDYLQQKGYARSLGTDSFVAIPVLTSQNRCIGVVVADRKRRDEPITVEQTNLLSTFVNQASIALENARLYEQMQENYRNIYRLKNYRDNVLQSIGVGILSTDASGRIADWNRAAEETLRPAGAKLQNLPLRELLQLVRLPADEQRILLDAIEGVISTGVPAHLHQMTLHPRDLKAITLNLTLSPLVEQNQERAGAVVTFENVTQEVRLEAELEKMRRFADIGQLAARTAHEVRNALSPIKGAAQIIRLELEAQGGSTEWPDIIVAEVDTLSRITSEMLDFARPIPLNLRALDLNEFLVNCVVSLSAFLSEHSVIVKWELGRGLPEMRADLVYLGQVVRNIAMNAAQAMPDGGSLTIRTEFDPGPKLVRIHFRDTGVGIPEEERERIFRPFVTSKTKGTGLGLPIVQKIVDQHGGRVDVESPSDGGTCFCVYLPLVPPHEASEVSGEETSLLSARPSGPMR